jgi:integrase
MSPRVGKRRRLERGIYEDATGRSVVATVAGEQREQRWPPNTPIPKLRLARAALQTALVDEQARAAKKRPAEGTLAADVDAYLKTLPSGRRRDDAAQLLAHWVAELGTKPRSAITAGEIRTVISTWIDEKKAPATTNRRRAALVALWHALDGKTAANVVRDVRKFREPEAARDIRPDALAYILEALPTRTANGRVWRGPVHLRVFAETGWPPAIIQALTEESLAYLDATPPYVLVPPRAKGEGVAGHAVPVTRRAVAALKEFRDAKAYGPISRNTLRRVFVEAVKRARVQWQKDRRGPWPVSPEVSPYWLRHAFGTRALRATGGNLKAVQRLMLHLSSRTTERYIRTAVDPLAGAAVQALDLGTALGTPTDTQEIAP